MRLVAWESTEGALPIRHLFRDLPSLRAGVPKLKSPPLLDIELDGGAQLDAAQAARIARAVATGGPGVLATGRLVHHLSPREVHDADGLLPVDNSGESLPCPVYHLARGLGDVGPAPVPRSRLDATAALNDIVTSLPPELYSLEIPKIPNAGARATRIPPEQDVHTVGALRDVTDEMFLGWRGAGVGTLTRLKLALIGLGEIGRQLPTVARLPANAPNRPPVLSRPLLVQIDERVDELDDRRREVARRRSICDGPPATLKVMAQQTGLTREWVRQLAKSLTARLDPDGELRATIDARLAQLRRGRNAPLGLAELPGEDAWFEGANRRARALAGVLQTLQADHAVIQWGEEPPFVSLRAAAGLPRLVESLRAKAKTWANPEDLRNAVRARVGEIDTPELAGLLQTAIGVYRLIGGKMISKPSVTEWVTWALDQVDHPLTLAQIRKRLKTVSVTMSPGGVRGAINGLDLINTGPATYILPAKLKAWAPHQPAFETIIKPMMEARPERQWSTRELRQALRSAGEIWAEDLPLHVVDYLLGLKPETFERLGRGLSGLTGRVAGVRLRIGHLCAQILEDAGTPLSQAELRGRVRERRGTFKQIAVFWPLVYMQNRRIGLGPRDLGLPTAAFKQMDAAAVAQLENTGRVSGEDLQELLERHGPEGLSLHPEVLCRVMRSCPSTLLDGPGRGSGIRRGHMARLTAEVEPEERVQGRQPATHPEPQMREPRAPKAPAPETPRTSTTRPPAEPTPTLASVLSALGPGHTLADIADAMVLGGLRRPAPGLLRMQLRMSGWTPVGDCWHPPRR